MTRKEFTQLTTLAASATLLPTSLLEAAANTFVSQRPLPANRKFRSEAIDALIEEVKKNITDTEIGWMFENCFPNTLDTTVFYQLKDGIPDTYVITGDIDAMWLRDSSAQVNAYLPLCANDKHLSSMVEGLIRRQTQCILLDPYANAFYKNNQKISQWKSDDTNMKPGVHERKWELDSLCYCIRLAYQYWKFTGNTAAFNDQWNDAMKLVVATMREQQRKDGKGSYHFQRRTETQSDTLPGAGYGNPCKPMGLICSAFRNSDDAAIYLYNIPENMFASSSLKQLAEMLQASGDKNKITGDCTELAGELDSAIAKYGIVKHPVHDMIYAYECDGYGNYLMMDDAGLPGLVSIPYLRNEIMIDEIYNNTRKFALSEENPYFYQSNIAEGIGSPHLASKGNMIWPMGIIARAITSTHDDEIAKCLKMLKATHAGKGFMHEGFNKNNPSDYTRSWFAWANSFFGEMIWKVYLERKKLL